MGHSICRREEPSHSSCGRNWLPPKSKPNKWQKVIFQMATVKGAFVHSKTNWHLTNFSKGKDKWKERLKEKVRSVPSRRRGFSDEQWKMYFGEKRRLICCFTRRPWRSIRVLVLLPIPSLSVWHQRHKTLIMCFIFNCLHVWSGSTKCNSHIQHTHYKRGFTLTANQVDRCTALLLHREEMHLCFSCSSGQLPVAGDASFWRPTTENSLKHFSHLRENYFKFLSTYKHVILCRKNVARHVYNRACWVKIAYWSSVSTQCQVAHTIHTSIWTWIWVTFSCLQNETLPKRRHWL